MYAILHSLFTDKVGVSDIFISQEGKVRAVLHKMLKGVKDVIYEEAYALEEGFKAVSILTAISPLKCCEEQVHVCDM